LRSFYWRIATAHEQLKIAFLIIRDGVRYQDLGSNYSDRRNAERTKRSKAGFLLYQVPGFRATSGGGNPRRPG